MPPSINRPFLVTLFTVLLAGTGAAADEKATRSDVLARLQSRCVKCHGDEKPKAGLTMTSLEAVGRGGKRGPVVIPGKPDESLMWQLVHEERMPPKAPLPAAERARLLQWIE